MPILQIQKIRKYNKKIFAITLLGMKFQITKKNKKQKQFNISNCDIGGLDELLNNGVKFPHMLGIVISKAATIGRNCIIYQNVTIGARTYKDGDYSKKENYPVLGDNVIVYAGAVIVGPVRIGNNVVIGANAVVTTDIPDNTIAVGIPAKVIKTLNL